MMKNSFPRLRGISVYDKLARVLVEKIHFPRNMRDDELHAENDRLCFKMGEDSTSKSSRGTFLQKRCH